MRSNVIGPISADDWYLLRMLKESINYMKEVGNPKYAINIRRQQKTYDYALKEALGK